MRSANMWLALVLVFAALGECRHEDIPDYDWDVVTALDEYVHHDDGAWNYTIIDRYIYTGVDIYMVNMTSQHWLDDELVSHSLWWHWLAIAVPRTILHPEHAMIINVGENNRNTEEYPGRYNLYNIVASRLAADLNTVCAVLMMQPNGPIRFYSDPANKGRTGDDLISYSWWWYLEGYRAGQDMPQEAILRFPMTKAAKRALDTVIAVSEEVRPGATNITKCIAAGASKRGWTAWSHAYTDRRVVASIPVVFSLLNLRHTMMAHYRAMGGAWSFALRPYYNNNVTQYMIEDDADEILDFEDAFRYRSRLATIPKLAINGVGDEFMFPQDFQHWWDEMGGPKWLMMNPNAEHILFPHWLRVYSTIVGWSLTFLNEGIEGLPTIESILEEEAGTGRVTMVTDRLPEQTRGMRAVTLEEDHKRDFRLLVGYPDTKLNPVWWRARNVTEVAEGTYELEEEMVDGEWVGFFVEGTWPTEYGFDMYFTTAPLIMPKDEYPVEPCTTPEECYGYLV